MAESDLYDVIIVGGGPAGLAAALYAARDRYKTLLLEKNGLPGGQILLTENVENYPGYESISGPDLIQAVQTQVEKFGAELRVNKAASSLTRCDDSIEVGVNGGKETYRGRAVILAPGSDYRQLGVPGERELRQATRVSYCATCDGAFYRDKHVLVVGGGNTAAEDAVYLASRFTRKLTLVHRRRQFRAQQVLVDDLYEAAKRYDIDIRLPYVLEEIVGDEGNTEVDHVRLRNVETDRTEDLEVDGVFIFIGMIPNTGFLRGAVEMDGAGYVTCDPVTLRTSMPGVFIAGDCRTQAFMQLATACADGVVAAMMLKDYYRNPAQWEAGATGEAIQSW